MTIREEWVDTFDTEPWELVKDGEYKGRMKEVNPIYTEWLEQKADDYRLMLKAWRSGWSIVVGWMHKQDKVIETWEWVRKLETFVVPKTSDIPELNDELREEFKKI